MVQKRRTRTQVHKAKIRVTCDLEIPQYQRDGGLEIEMRANGALCGELMITGANVYFRRTRNSNWSNWNFSQFSDLLEANKK